MFFKGTLEREVYGGVLITSVYEAAYEKTHINPVVTGSAFCFLQITAMSSKVGIEDTSLQPGHRYTCLYRQIHLFRRAAFYRGQLGIMGQSPR